VRLPNCRTLVAGLSVTALIASGCGRASPCESDNGGCDPHATCAESGSQVVCTCDSSQGYGGDGKTCTLDPCADHNGGCDPNATCSAAPGATVATCTCETSLGFSGDGKTCTGSVAVPATDGTLGLPYDVTIDGMGSQSVGTISMTHGVGTIEINGTTLPAIAYEQIPFPAANNDTLYQILAVAPGYWVVAWAYCSGGMLNDAYFESTDGALGMSEDASGTCAATSTNTSPTVQFPAVSMTGPSVIHGFTMTGADLSFDGAHPGSMTQGGDTWVVYPFTTVDCSTGCGTPGWYELHSVLVDPKKAEACYGIYYLESQDPSHVMLDYVICLPSLTDPVGHGATFAATYTHP
jgi:hypothetical protein